MFMHVLFSENVHACLLIKFILLQMIQQIEMLHAVSAHDVMEIRELLSGMNWTIIIYIYIQLPMDYHPQSSFRI